ncbi:MAG: DUF2235 domain-containing protein [Planctomycetia bacterium]
MKRLIICSDGTWQDLYTDYPTNVVKMAQAVLPMGADGVQQIVYYDGGLGTKEIGTEKSLIDELLKLGSGGLGLGIDRKIQNVYLFLCLNYDPGDEIYLVGFSRGAYTVRCLAGLIYNSGLPHRQFIRKIPTAYELYRNKSHDNQPNGNDSVRFRNDYGDRVPIKALCCWDTVASVGLPDLIPGIKLDAKFNERYSFYDSKINSDVEHAFHAVSIDENRKVFYFTPMESTQPGQLSQVWFPGGHGSVGGGVEEEQGLSDRALEWMLNHVAALGLSVDPSNIEYGLKPMYDTPFTLETSPFGYKTRQFPETTTFSDLDISVKKRWKTGNYQPQNLRDKFGTELDQWIEDI